MKTKTVAVTFFVCFAAHTAQARFVGTTSEVLVPGQDYQGFGGIAAAHAACRAAFRGTHLCTTKELYFSNLRQPPGVKVWIYPHFVGGVSNEYQMADFFGFHDQPNDLTCAVWINPPNTPKAGLVMLEDGTLTREGNCEQALPLACCR